MMKLEEAALATNGEAQQGTLVFDGVSSDSRSIKQGELFVALQGPNFDGQSFVEQVLAQGAVAAMVTREWGQARPQLLDRLLLVDDTLSALGCLAAYWRTKFQIPLVGVTGSNGKTTVKEMTAAILRAQAQADGYDPAVSVLATQGNFNNDIGMPLMLLRLRTTHRAAVIEMGMNHLGEISTLTRIAQPTVAVVNNAQRAHLEGLGSLKEVARAKGEIYEGLGQAGIAVINADDPHAKLWRELNAERSVVTFGINMPADVTARFRNKGLANILSLRTPAGAAEVELAVPGAHNVRNALAAAAAAMAAGAKLNAVVDGLAGYRGVKGRLQVRPARGGAMLIDDTYNANPDSVRAAIDVLASTPGRKILVLGDMGEIGEATGQYHDEVGGYAKSQGIDQLFALGEHSVLAAKNFGAGGRHFESVEALVKALEKELNAESAVLVKGSRFMKMERVTNAVAVE